MKQNSYDQFFKKASEVKRGSTAKPSFKPNSKVAREDHLRKALNVRKSIRPGVPWSAIIGLICTIMMGGYYLVFPEAVESFLNRIEISAIGQVEASSAPAEKSTKDSLKGEKSSATGSNDESSKVDGETKIDSEDLSHFEKLRQRKDELDARERELAELEEELQRQKVELDKRLLQLDEMRGQISKTLKDRVDVDQEKVNKLVELYSSMKPKQAAQVIGTINEDLAVEVLAKMKKKSAAEIMNLLTPEKARVLSEKYTGYMRMNQEPKG